MSANEDGTAGLAPVVPLRGDPDEAPVRTGERTWCQHDQVTVDEVCRRVYCRNCGREVDAFGALLKFARRYESYERRVRELKREAAAVGQRVTDLKREERNAKARARRRKA